MLMKYIERNFSKKANIFENFHFFFDYPTLTTSSLGVDQILNSCNRPSTRQTWPSLGSRELYTVRQLAWRVSFQIFYHTFVFSSLRVIPEFINCEMYVTKRERESKWSAYL